MSSSMFLYLDPEWVKEVEDDPEHEARGLLGGQSYAIQRMRQGTPFLQFWSLPTDPTFVVSSLVPAFAIVKVTVRDTADSYIVDLVSGLYKRGKHTRAQVTQVIEDAHWIYEVAVSGKTIRTVKNFITDLYAGKLTPYEPWDSDHYPVVAEEESEGGEEQPERPEEAEELKVELEETEEAAEEVAEGQPEET